jgi:hypothetical protein
MGEIDFVNYTQEEVTKIAENFKLKPFGNRVIITVNRVEEEGEVLTTNNIIAEEQYVVAVGPMAERFVAAGDKVILDLEKMTVRTPVDHDQFQVNTQIKIDPIEVDGMRFAMVNDNCFKAKFI